MQIDKDAFQEMVAQKYVSVQKHSYTDLLIYNYTHRAQFDNVWNDVTKQARGLITDLDGNIIQRPFKKFFNLSQHEGTLPDEDYEVYEKMDGCWRTDTVLNLWDGGTITIGEVVRKRLSPTLIGRNENGKIVPCTVVDWFNNGRKFSWLSIKIDQRSSRLSGGRGSNFLRVTPNHSIYVNGKFSLASDIKTGDTLQRVIDSCDERSLHVIKSGLLGDGSISSNRYTEGHKEEEYRDFINKWLGNCCIKQDQRISGYGSIIYRSISKAYENLSHIRNEWYTNGKKIIPKDLSWMDDFSFAKWYMDDGSLSHSEYQKDRACFATNGFSEQDVIRLTNKLKDFYGVDAVAFYSKGKGWSIRVNYSNGSINNFWKSISPHVIDCMRYKLPVEYRNVSYTERVPGYEEKITIPCKVLSVDYLEVNKKNFPSGSCGFDIKTTTGNYFAKGVLVHNSLGILYWVNDSPYIATRGSFTSDQAVHASKVLRSKYIDYPFDRSLTYLFEIVYRENRIVVDYGSMDDIILLAIVDTQTGEEYSIHDKEYPFPVVSKHEGTIEELQAKHSMRENFEGFVIKFVPSNYRLKVKMDEYLRLHRLITGVNARHVWDLLRNGQSMDQFIDKVPDEFYEWVTQTSESLTKQYADIFAEAHMKYYAIGEKLGLNFSRKDFAQEAMLDKEYSPMMFSLLDGRSIEDYIWKMIEPSGTDTFKVDEGS